MGNLFSCCVDTVEEELDYANDRVREIEKDVVNKVRDAEEAVERVRDAEEDVTERVRDLEDDASSTRGRTDDDDEERAAAVTHDRPARQTRAPVKGKPVARSAHKKTMK